MLADKDYADNSEDDWGEADEEDVDDLMVR